MTCPYCHAEPANTRDHVLPQFLGGQYTVWAGSCNHRFGHDFEGPVSRDLAPYLVVLARCGIPSPVHATWPRATVDNAGHPLDLDTDGDARLSDPIIEKDSTGRVVRVISRGSREAARHAKRFLAKGAKEVVRGTERVTILNPVFGPVRLTIGRELQRLVVKMCAGLAAREHPEIDPLSAEVRAFLLGSPGAPNHVRFPSITYPALDALRPPLAHTIIVEANPATRRSYGVVQLFGSLTFYIPLRDDYDGPDVTLLLTHDIITHEEVVSSRPALRLPACPRHMTPAEHEERVQAVHDRFNQQVKERRGENAMLLDIKPA